MGPSNKDVPTVMLVATEWDQVLKTLREKIGDLVDKFAVQTQGELVRRHYPRKEDYDATMELSAKFGWEPNFHWVTRRYVDVPSSPFGKLVVYESNDPELLVLSPPKREQKEQRVYPSVRDPSWGEFWKGPLDKARESEEEARKLRDSVDPEEQRFIWLSCDDLINRHIITRSLSWDEAAIKWNGVVIGPGMSSMTGDIFIVVINGEFKELCSDRERVRALLRWQSTKVVSPDPALHKAAITCLMVGSQYLEPITVFEVNSGA
jgi:hypothetical protein